MPEGSPVTTNTNLWTGVLSDVKNLTQTFLSVSACRIECEPAIVLDCWTQGLLG
jgi:hypothetical protein